MIVEISPGDFTNALGVPDDGTYDGQLVPRHKTPAEIAEEVARSVMVSDIVDPMVRFRAAYTARKNFRRRTPR